MKPNDRTLLSRIIRLACCTALSLTLAAPSVLAHAPRAVKAKPAGKAAATRSPASSAAAKLLAVYDHAMQLTRANFYDQTMRGLPWDEMVQAGRRTLGNHPDEAHLKTVVNGVLGQLHASHTVFLSDADQEYWALQSIFSGHLDGYRVRQIGAWFSRRGSRWFVRNVFPDSPAERAGLRRGDEIITVDGAPLAPVKSFTRLQPNEKANVAFRRLPWEKPRTVAVPTVLASFQEGLLRTVQDSKFLYDVRGKKVAYVALPAGTHAAFRTALTQAVSQAESTADALVLDLRDGFGGADLAYLDPFFDMPKAASPKGGVQKAVFDKPLVLLIDGGTSSGKEWLAWFVKKQGRGTLVGTRTAGAFLAGKLFDVAPRRFALYLAVADTQKLSTNLEGHGVEPDIPVVGGLMYAAGIDPQLKKALEVAASKAK